MPHPFAITQLIHIVINTSIFARAKGRKGGGGKRIKVFAKVELQSRVGLSTPGVIVA